MNETSSFSCLHLVQRSFIGSFVDVVMTTSHVVEIVIFIGDDLPLILVDGLGVRQQPARVAARSVENETLRSEGKTRGNRNGGRGNWNTKEFWDWKKNELVDWGVE